MLQMHYWRMLKASKFKAVHCGLTAAAVWLLTAPQRSPGGRWEGSEASEEFLCHIRSQVFSVHLSGGRKAPEMIGKRPHAPQPCCQAGALTCCIFKTTFPSVKIVTSDTPRTCSAPRSRASTQTRVSVRAPKEYSPRFLQVRSTAERGALQR